MQVYNIYNVYPLQYGYQMLCDACAAFVGTQQSGCCLPVETCSFRSDECFPAPAPSPLFNPPAPAAKPVSAPAPAVTPPAPAALPPRGARLQVMLVVPSKRLWRVALQLFNYCYDTAKPDSSATDRYEDTSHTRSPKQTALAGDFKAY